MTGKLLSALKKTKYNFIFAVIFAILLLLPDFIFEMVFPNIKYLTDYLFIFALMILGYILSFTGIYYFSFILLLLLTMQSIQLFHIAYFARPINPLDISKIFSDFADIYSSGLGDMDDIWIVIPLLILTFGGIFFTFYKFRRQLGFSLIAILIVSIALCVKPERAMRKTLKSFLPADTRYSIHNSINTFSYYLVKSMDNQTIASIVPHDFYQPYTVTPNHREKPELIVLVMGESLSTNQMSLFHPELPSTTPHLDNLKKDSGFLAVPAISGAVSTHASLPIFFNMMKEPGNINLFKTNEANLFRLAKQAGYTTHFLSAYDVKQTHNIGVPYIDDIRTSEQDFIAYSRKNEDHMVELFQKMDLSSGKHFVVLNFKSVHSPYESNYAHRGNEFDRFRPQDDSREQEALNTYRNAVLYIDDVVHRLLTEFKSKVAENAYFILTSDHGELLGRNNYYGHNILLQETAEVPFLIYSPNPDRNLYADLKQNPEISHYEIADTIATLLGYDVKNPNHDENTVYIHGNNLYEEYEIIELSRQPGRKFSPQFQGSVSSFVKRTPPKQI